MTDANQESHKNMVDRAHINEEISQAWDEGEIVRLCKGKCVKGNCLNERGITLASNVGNVYRRIINERVKSRLHITKVQAQGKACENGKTAYILFLDVQKAYDKAWLDTIIYTLPKNGIKGKTSGWSKKLNSNLTAKKQTRYRLTRKIKIKDNIRQWESLSVIEYAALIDEIIEKN